MTLRRWIIAAVLLLGAALAWWRWPRFQLERAEVELNRYAAPHSLYWPGQTATPLPFLPAEGAATLASLSAAIDSSEARLGPTPRSFYLRGRLAALRGAVPEAIRLTRLAALLEPDSVDLQLAYGVTLALRAAAENRAIDWATAADTLLEASVLPGFPAVGFADLALVSERLPAPRAAADAWKKAIAQAPSALRPAFALRLQSVEQQAQLRQRLLAQVAAQRQPSRDVPGSAETLLSTALSDWLARRADFSPDLARLAAYLRADLSDPTLEDLLRAPPNTPADQALARATLALNQGNYQQAGDSGLEALRLYGPANPAGQALAGVQAAFGLRRSRRVPECLQIAELSTRLAAARGYRWAELRSLQETLACKTRTRVVDTLAERESIGARSLASPFLDMQLRGASYQVEPSKGYTAPVEAWHQGQRGLTSFWTSTLPPPFAVNFYSALGLMAESFGYSRLAVLLFGEAMAVMEGSPNQWLRAAIREDFLRLNPTAQLPGPALTEIESAARELTAGQSAPALARLRRVTNVDPFPYTQLGPYERITLLPLMGRALWQQGQQPEALRHFRVLIDETVAKVSQLKGRRQRYSTAAEVGPAWRLLTEAQLETEGPEAALRTWQTFRILPNPGQKVDLAPPPGQVRLSIAILPSGPAVWFADSRGIAVNRPFTTQLARRAQRFSALVANADSPLAQVNEAARELYDLLLAPFEDRLQNARTLIVDPDGPLAVLPWGALRDRQNRSLLSRLAIVQTIGWGSSPAPLAAPDWQPALVVAEPAVDPHDRARFPSLAAARREAEQLGTLFPRDLRYLSGPDARVDALQQEIPHRQLFHFAGHGVANGGNGALVLAGEPQVGTRLITASEIAALDLHQLRLATLAACSSGAGEDRGSINVESLVQAFLDAGASRVLASRWNVDSRATSEVMHGFYQRLRQGLAPAAALREASLAVQRTPLLEHPYFWAAFQLFGQP